MKEAKNNIFIKGLVTDSSNLQTPPDLYTYLENGTFITYQGDELIIQNIEGNVERSMLKEDYVPVGIKSLGNIAYIVSAEGIYQEEEKDVEYYRFSNAQHKFWLNAGTYTLQFTNQIQEAQSIQIKVNGQEISSFTLEASNSIQITVEGNSEITTNLGLDYYELTATQFETVRTLTGFSGRGEVGSYPSPNYELAESNGKSNQRYTTTLEDKYSPLYNYNGDGGIPINPLNLSDELSIGEFNSQNFNFQFDKEVEIVALQRSYDLTVNIIFTDGFNRPKLVNSRFSVVDQNTVEIRERTGEDDNVYIEDNFNNTLNHILSSNKLAFFNFNGQTTDGELICGTYKYYFKYETSDGNATDVIAESFNIPVRLGTTIYSTRNSTTSERSTKSNNLSLFNLDRSYNRLRMFIEYSSGTEGIDPTTQLFRVEDTYLITSDSLEIKHTGFETTTPVDSNELLRNSADIFTYKTGTEIKGRLLIGNILGKNVSNNILESFATLIETHFGTTEIPATTFADSYDMPSLNEPITFNDLSLRGNTNGCYYNPKNVHDLLGYFGGETYCFGVSFIYDDNTETEVFAVRGIDQSRVPFAYEDNSLNSNNLFNTITGENIKGIFRFPERNRNASPNETRLINNGQVVIMHPKFKIPSIPQELIDEGVVGLRFHRARRKENVVSQGLMMNTIIVPGANRTIAPLYTYAENDRGYTEFNSRYIPSYDFYIESSHRKDEGGDFGGTPLVYGQTAFELHGVNIWKFSYFHHNARSQDGLDFYENKKLAFISPDLIVNPTGTRSTINSENYFIHRLFSITHNFRLSTSVFELEQRGVPTDAYFSLINPSSYENVIFTTLRELPHKVDYVNANSSGKTENGFTSLFEDYGIAQNDGGEQAIFGHNYNDYLGISLVNTSIPLGTPAQGGGRISGASDTELESQQTWANNYSSITGTEGATEIINIYGNSGFYTTETLESLYNPESENFTPISQPIYLSNDIATSTRANQIVTNDFIGFYSLDNLLDNSFLSLYNGDTYINPTIRRLYQSSFSKQALNTNLTVEASVANINPGYSISFFAESKYNVADRDTNIFDVNEESERTYGPFAGRTYSSNEEYSFSADDHPWRNVRVPESSENNTGSQKVDIRINTGFDRTLPFIENSFSTRIHASEIDAREEFVNNYRLFNLLTFQDYSRALGQITAIRNVNGRLICVHENGITQIPINERIGGIGDSAGEVLFRETQVLNPLQNVAYISEKIGSKWMSSVIVSENTVYGVDMDRGTVWRVTPNGLELISDFKVNLIVKEQQNLLKDSQYTYTNKVSTYYEPLKNNIIFCFTTENPITLGYNEIPFSHWDSLFSWKPYMMFSIRDQLYSFNSKKDSNRIWEHYSGDYMTFYGEQEFFVLEFVSSMSTQVHQMLDNLKVVGEHIYPEFIDYTTEDETVRQFVRPRNEVVEQPYTKNPLLQVTNYNAEYKEGHMYIEVAKRESDTNRGILFDNKRIRGKYFKIRMFYRPEQKMFIQNIVSIITQSYA